jgi:hypothetical protein
MGILRMASADPFQLRFWNSSHRPSPWVYMRLLILYHTVSGAYASALRFATMPSRSSRYTA